MKKLLILVIPALVFVLAGCSSQESEDKEQEKSKDKQTQDKTSKEQQTEAYDTSDDYIRSIMKKDPSKLNDKELAIYNEVNKQISNKTELSESDKAIRADQRAMSEKRNAKSPDEQARIDEAMKKKEEQESGYEKNKFIPHGHVEEFQKIQDETERELSQGELAEEYERRNQEPQTQQESQQTQQQEQQQTQQAPQAQETQKTQQAPTESNTPEQQEPKRETIEK
ncbi:hypothetical protein [Staphylococcus nepalensis]|uniref:hypothetical protein n=1 Tax=Staphylococcus nepalensis TaxID=214473 RepID=UPI000E00408B|nr:hypothetical protein [Staphylococcus nepalensis]SUM66773.1 Uncharacterised protein [Staphylococcus nepalensis]SUM94710.1 Uncharacterised protein [Staphylococcus nepalensis]